MSELLCLPVRHQSDWRHSSHGRPFKTYSSGRLIQTSEDRPTLKYRPNRVVRYSTLTLGKRTKHLGGKLPCVLMCTVFTKTSIALWGQSWEWIALGSSWNHFNQVGWFRVIWLLSSSKSSVIKLLGYCWKCNGSSKGTLFDFSFCLQSHLQIIPWDKGWLTNEVI